MAMAQPKKPAGGAYGQFLAEKRPELQTQCKGQPITAITKLASEKFKALSEEDKKIYQEKFVAAKAKYDEDMKAFLEAGGEKKAIKKKGKKDIKKKKDPQAPKKPAGGAYGCFLAKNRAAFMKECSGQPVTAVTKLASAKWKELSDEDKKIYEEEFQKKKEEYQEAMKSYVPLSSADGDDEPPAKKRKTKEAKEGAAEAAKSKESKAAEKADAKAAKAQAKAEAKEAKEAKAKAKAEAKPKGKAKAKAADANAGVKLEPAVAAKAEKAGWKDVLVKLAARPDVIASGKSQTAMLQALEKVNGLLHPARRALLGAWVEAKMWKDWRGEMCHARKSPGMSRVYLNPRNGGCQLQIERVFCGHVLRGAIVDHSCCVAVSGIDRALEREKRAGQPAAHAVHWEQWEQRREEKSWMRCASLWCILWSQGSGRARPAKKQLGGGRRVGWGGLIYLFWELPGI